LEFAFLIPILDRQMAPDLLLNIIRFIYYLEVINLGCDGCHISLLGQEIMVFVK